MASHQIILQVNTTRITPTTIDDNCLFVGQTEGVSNEDFTITAANGDTVTWSGVSLTAPSSDEVRITNIDYETGKHLFGTDDLTPDRSAPTVVSGTIINAVDNDVESYKILFDVYSSGSRRGSYEIDPKIQINAGTR